MEVTNDTMAVKPVEGDGQGLRRAYRCLPLPIDNNFDLTDFTAVHIPHFWHLFVFGYPRVEVLLPAVLYRQVVEGVSEAAWYTDHQVRLISQSGL